MMQEHPDVKQPVHAHLPIHAINFLSICDKNKSWAASLGASLDGLICFRLSDWFLLVCSKTRSFWAQHRLLRAPGKNGKQLRYHWELCLPGSLPITWQFRRGITIHLFPLLFIGISFRNKQKTKTKQTNKVTPSSSSTWRIILLLLVSLRIHETWGWGRLLFL